MVSLFVLLLNDHLLKQAWPGLVTGKVSDVAGLLVAPPLVALLLGRRADLAAAILTGALYTFVKATETGAEAASLAWTALAGPSRVLADHTDLLALPALGFAWWVRQRTLRPDPRRRGVLVILPLAVLSVTATGSAPMAPSALSVVVDQGSVVVSSDLGDLGDPDLVSDDGGRTWRPTALLTEDESRRAQKAACVPKEPERCYSIAEGLMRVMQSDDGGETWTVSWEVSPDRVEALEHALSAEGVRSTSLAVQPRQGGGHVVVVANGPDGVAVRDVDGQWRRLGFAGTALSEDAAVPLTGPARPTGGEMWTAALAALWTVLAGLAVQAASSSPRRARPGLIVALSGVGAVALLPGPYLVDGPVPALLGLTGAVLVITSVITAASLVTDARLGSRGVVNALAAGVLVGLAVAGPFRGWGEGWIDGYGTALTLALLLGLGSAVGGLVTLRRSARQRVVRGST